MGIIRSRRLSGSNRRSPVAIKLFHGVIASLLLTAAPALAARTSGPAGHVLQKTTSAQRTSPHRAAEPARHAALHHRGKAFLHYAQRDESGDDVASTDEHIVSVKDVSSPAGELLDHGIASWYSVQGNGTRTSSGERFDENAMTAAHTWLPLGTRVRVTIVGTNESVVVTINDRQGATSRAIDLSKGAARQLGIISRGTARVTLTRA